MTNKIKRAIIEKQLFIERLEEMVSLCSVVSVKSYLRKLIETEKTSITYLKAALVDLEREERDGQA